jgi:hypothetical protein
MAMTDKYTKRAEVQAHFRVRVIGLTGLLVLAIGLVLTGIVHASAWRYITIAIAFGGGAAVAWWLLAETKAAADQIRGQRGTVGLMVALQVLFAALLLIGVNMCSAYLYFRADCTRDRQFTIPRDIREQLSRLSASEPTTIVLHQRHVVFGQADKPDNFDTAAERKVVEKVRDLVEQFQELGPRFKIVVLDVQEEDYQTRLDELKKDSPALGDAIEKSPESSIFFFSKPAGDDKGKVQRLAFQELYQLDKKASQESDDAKGNLVLYYQGVKPFADKVLNIEERKPRIAFGIVHEILSTEGSDEYGMAGARKALEARGFECRDIMLKKGFEEGRPEAAAFTFDEYKYERLEAAINELDSSINSLERELKELRAALKDWQDKSADELDKTPLAKQLKDQLGFPKVTEQIRKEIVDRVFKPTSVIRQLELDESRRERNSLALQQKGLSVENLEEQRRIADVRAKTTRLLSECDLLVVPRMTLFNAARGRGYGIPDAVHKLEDEQVRAIKEFMKAGKPVLVCFGPIESDDPMNFNPMQPPRGGPDQLETELERLGFRFLKQTVLFNVESKAFAERREGLIILGANVEVPAVDFDWEPGADHMAARSLTENLKPNPIRESMRLLQRGLDKSQALDLRLRNPRPVYFEPKRGETLPFDPVFMETNSACWNEDQPFATRERTPHFEQPKPTDPSRGTLREKRRGPFSIGVATPVTLPREWYLGEPNATPATVRVEAIGHGGVFMGANLSPAKEKLLLDSCNWLLGRDDLLATRQNSWSYPRAALRPAAASIWTWTVVAGLPVLCAYLGIVVLMLRRIR